MGVVTMTSFRLYSITTGILLKSGFQTRIPRTALSGLHAFASTMEVA